MNRIIAFVVAVFLTVPALAYDPNTELPFPLQGPVNISRNSLWMIDTGTTALAGTRTMPSGVIPSTKDFWMDSVCTTIVGPIVGGVEQPTVIRILNTPPGESPAVMWTARNGTSCMPMADGPLLFPPGTQFAIELIAGSIPSFHTTRITGLLTITNPKYWN